MWKFFTNSGHEKKVTSPSSAFLATGLTIGGDVNLYRSGVDTLKTDDRLVVGGNLETVHTNLAMAFRVHPNFFATGEPAITLHNNAGLEKIRLGNNALMFESDTNLYRLEANHLYSDDRISSASFLVAHRGTANQVLIGYDGVAAAAGIAFGSDMTANMWRSGAYQLRTGAMLQASTYGISTSVVAGVVSDANFPAGILSGHMAVDSVNNRLYVRVGSTWKYAILT